VIEQLALRIFQGMQALATIAQFNRIAPFADQVLVSGTNFLTGLALVRTLGLEDYGVYALLYTGVLFCAALQQSCIIAPLMTNGPRLEAVLRFRHMRALSVFQTIFALLAVCFVAIATWCSTGMSRVTIDPEVLAALALMTFFLQFQDLYRRSYYAFQNFGRLLLSDVIACSLQIALVWGATLMTHVELSDMMFVVAGSAAVSALWGAFTYGIEFNRAEIRSVMRENWRMSRWLLPSALVQWAGANAVFLIGSVHLGTVAVGALRAAQNAVAVLNVLFIALENTLPVKASIIHRDGGREDLLRYVLVSSASIMAVTLVVVVPLGLFPVFFLEMLYGDGLVEHADVLRGFCLIYILSGIGIPVRAALRTTGRARSIFIAYVLSTTVSVTAVYPLVVLLDVNGMVLTLALAQVVLLTGYLAQYLFLSRGWKA